MSDLEFDVLDELYFVHSFPELMELTDLEDYELKPVLQKLINKGWVKCLENVNDDVTAEVLDFELQYRQYYYLATKAGLMAHNTN